MKNVEGPSKRQIVIVAYKPKPGRLGDLIQHPRTPAYPAIGGFGYRAGSRRWPGGRRDGRRSFEWEAGGVEKAHTNPRVGALWARYAEACDIVSLNTLAEAGEMFARFTPLDI